MYRIKEDSLEGIEVRFITGISRTVTKDGCCAGVVNHIILDWIFSVLFNDFKARGLRKMSTPPMVALTDFFQADTNTNVKPLIEILVFYFVFAMVILIVTAKVLKSQDGNLFFARVKTGRPGA